MATSESTNIQDTKKNNDIIMITFKGVGLPPNTASVNACGTLKYEIIQENEPPAASKMKTTLVTTPVDAAIGNKSFILTLLKTSTSKIKAYNTENAAASVGLNIPE